MYYVNYKLKDGVHSECSGPFEKRETAEAFIIAFVNRNQVLWITVIEKEN